MAMDVVSEIIIARPLATVARYAADPERAPDWYANIRSVEWVTEPKLEVGARVTFVAQFLGRTLRYTYEIAAYEPERRLIMRTSEGPFPMETAYLWDAAADASTRMTLRNRGEPAGFAAFLAPFLGLAMRRENRHDLARLKHLLESAEPGGADARPAGGDGVPR